LIGLFHPPTIAPSHAGSCGGAPVCQTQGVSIKQTFMIACSRSADKRLLYNYANDDDDDDR
jgi:hypothetical protein